jgi:hypothetical protein
MSRLFAVGALIAAAVSSTGCFWNMYSADPIRRYNQLFNQSSDLMLIEDEYERFWQVDQPSNLTPYRYHGYALSIPRHYRMSPSERPGFETRFMR